MKAAIHDLAAVVNRSFGVMKEEHHGGTEDTEEDENDRRGAENGQSPVAKRTRSSR